METYRHPRLKFRVVITGTILFARTQLLAQPNPEVTNALPKLSPPYGELPPTFWEQHGTLIIAAGVGTVMLAVLAVWRITRPRPTVRIPPEVLAQDALESLRRQPEDGAALSRISQILRQYFIGAFSLAPGEWTTAEFQTQLARCDKVNNELATVAAEFLRGCDERKFSPNTGPGKMDAVDRALKLIAEAEQSRMRGSQTADSPSRGGRA